jgi:osmotically-inducible protein OsmY
MKKILLGSAILSALMLQSCIPVAVAGAGTKAVELGTQDRTVGQGLDDLTLETKINKRYFDKDVNDLFHNIDVDVVDGKVFLTGNVTKPETAILAVAEAWKVSGVKEVVNEIQVEDASRTADAAQDVWIEGQIATRMLFTKGIRSANYTVECVNGIVYLLGTARDDAELRRVTDIASRTKYVKQVISHVVVK